MKQSDEGSLRFKGVVVNFLPRRGYGFIMGEDGVKVFVHYSDIKGKSYRTLMQGEEVEYDCIQGPKGLQAVHVVRLNPPPDVELPPLDSGRTW